jgi:hypothetical protein
LVVFVMARCIRGRVVDVERGQHDFADKSFPEKSISHAYRCQRNVSAADIALAKKPRNTESMQAVR